MKNEILKLFLSQKMSTLSFWIGRWWLCIWKTKFKEINIGIGDDLGEGNFGPFSIINHRKGIFWVSVARPTITFLNRKY